MEKTIRVFVLLYFLSIGIISCDSNSDLEPKAKTVSEVGFTGKMPDGTDFGVEGNLAANGLTGGGSSSSPYTGTHVITIRNDASGWDISVELP